MATNSAKNLTTQNKKAQKPEGTNGPAVTGFVLSVCGFFTGITFIAGLIVSAIGLSQTKKTGQEGRGLALAGTIIGAIGTGLTIIGTIVLIIFIGALAANSGTIKDTINKARENCEYTYSYDQTSRSYRYQLVCE